MQRMRAIFSQVPITSWARRGKVGPTILSMHVERRHALKGQNKNEKSYLFRSFAAVRRWRRLADTRCVCHRSWQTCLELANLGLRNKSIYWVKRTSLFFDWRKVPKGHRFAYFWWFSFAFATKTKLTNPGRSKIPFSKNILTSMYWCEFF